MSSRVLPTEFPPVDARLVAPECGYEIIEGRIVKVPPAREPHGSRHAKVGALLEACARDDYDVALDMLTRVSETSDIAPDAAVFRRARDPSTGGRYVEDLAFEVLSTQLLSECSPRARLLSNRGVRRVFAVDVKHTRVFEWSAEADDWRMLPSDGVIEDEVLAAPLRIEALVHAIKADDAMAEALLAKHNPVLTAAVAEGREKGIAEGREKGIAEGREKGIAEGREKGIVEGRAQGIAAGRLSGLREALVSLVEGRGLSLDAGMWRRIDEATAYEVERWLRRAATVRNVAELFE